MPQLLGGEPQVMFTIAPQHSVDRGVLRLLADHVTKRYRYWDEGAGSLYAYELQRRGVEHLHGLIGGRPQLASVKWLPVKGEVLQLVKQYPAYGLPQRVVPMTGRCDVCAGIHDGLAHVPVDYFGVGSNTASVHFLTRDGRGWSGELSKYVTKYALKSEAALFEFNVRRDSR